MLEIFKFLVLCLISVFITNLSGSWLYTCTLFIVLSVLFYDFDFTTALERHAITKVKQSYLKVRNLYAILQSETIKYPHTPIMNSVNKQSSSFDLSRFSKSGNALSPITNSASSLTSKRLIQSRQTSTPLARTSPWQKNGLSPSNHLRTPMYQGIHRSPRYSLSTPHNTSKSTPDDSPSRPTIQTVTGPLLASTRFNVNLGVYTDTKSPGLTSRVVQYHNELSGAQSSTHQTKYGSPGQFPIVQLYRRELPILPRTPRRCTVRIAPPDPISYTSEHTNTILRNSFHPGNVELTNAGQIDTEISTRSVLEALKEISRKRIHTSDDEDEMSKRQRKCTLNSPSSTSDLVNKDGKRMREYTPPKPKDSTPLGAASINNASKRICVVNEIESSLSSSKCMRSYKGQKRKSSLNESDDANTKRRITNGELVSVETQTHISNGTATSTDSSTSVSTNTNDTILLKISTAAQTETNTDEYKNIQTIITNARAMKKAEVLVSDTNIIDDSNSTLNFKHKETNSLSAVFKESPLGIMKSNRLEFVLSAMSGQEPEIKLLPDMSLTDMKNETDGKDVVSILSPKNKAKHDKHVSFMMPTTTDVTDVSKTAETDRTDSVPSLPFLTPNSVPNFSIPISLSTSQIVSSPIKFSSPSTSKTTPSTISFNFNSTAPVVTETPTLASPSLGAVTTMTVAANNTISTPVVKDTTKLPNFGVSQQNGLSFGTPAFGSPNSLKPVFGGLVPSTNATTVLPSIKTNAAPPTFQFSTSNQGSNAISNPSVTSGVSMFNTNVTPAVSFAVSSVPATIQTPIAFGNAAPLINATSQIVSQQSTTPSFGSTNSPSFGTTTNPTTNTSSTMFNFAAVTKPVAKPAVTSAAPAFSFPGATTSQPKAAGGFKFDLAKPSISTKTLVEMPKPSGFGGDLNKSSTFSFGQTKSAAATTTAPPSFGASITSKSAGGFGTPSSAASIPGGFGVPNTTANMFGAPGTSSTGAFGVANTTTSTAVFGTTNATANAVVFGAPNTTTATIVGGFSTTPATTANTGGFGSTAQSTGMFGTPATTAPPAFGVTTTTAPPAFGATAPPAFGATPTTAPPAFGAITTTAPLAFGAQKPAESTSGFGSFGAAPNTVAPSAGFGNFSAPTTTQNSTNNFGAFGATANPQSNAFGGVPVSTTSSFAFGTNTASKPFAFGGAVTTTSTAAGIFGTATPSTNSTGVFGAAAPPAFGAASATSNTFGTPATTTAASSFGQPNASGVFGAASSGFGTGTSGSVFGTTNNNTNNNNTSTFGTSATPSAFGASGQQQAASTFGAGSTTQGNVFGGNQTNTFGAPTNANQANTFGSTPSVSFGGGGGFNGASTQPPAFGAFGTPAGSQPAAAPQGGVFAFGVPTQAAPPAAGPSNAFQFGAASTPAKPSGFNFSATANTPNINFGGGTANFGAAAPPAFGSPAASQFNSPQPSAGMFSIGSGSTAPKQRPMIKARRRN